MYHKEVNIPRFTVYILAMVTKLQTYIDIYIYIYLHAQLTMKVTKRNDFVE